MSRPQRRAPRRPSAELLRILVVDDDPAQLEIAQRILGEQGHRVTVANRAAPAIEFLNRRPYDLLITDLVMPETNGMDLASYVRENDLDIDVILMSGYASIATALDRAKLGAHAYLEKPFTPEDLITTVDTCAVTAAERRLTAPGARQAGDGDGVRWGLRGKSPGMLRVFRLILKIAPSDVIVLLLGESGTGKNLVARAIHQESLRSCGSFVVVNCAAIPEHLAESALFGHVRGAFTDAERDHKGSFAQADGGTLFLDEIAELPLDLQSKLLRALEAGRILPVGAEREVQVDVRVIAATNKDLPKAADRGEFRADLFYRIATVPIDIPPLRDRGDDIILIARHLLDGSARTEGRAPLQLTAAAEDKLRSHDWPGNVRELKNVATGLALLCDSDIIDARDVTERLREADSRPQDGEFDSRRQDRDSIDIPGPDAPLSVVGEWHCQRALDHFNGNKSQTARSLRIGRKRLGRLLDRQNNKDEDAED